ncbi:MAG: ATP-dependent DNA helicase, partial [Desulfomonilaceae bacterium]
RTVVIMQSDRFDGHKFIDMTATEFHQMTGRCGRRGIDNVGFILIVPGKYLDIGLVRELLLSKPEPLRSRININFSMTLNLLLSHDPAAVSELLEFSFASFSEGPSKAKKITEKLVSDFSNHMEILIELGYVDEAGKPTYDGSWAAKLRLDHPLLIAELIRSGEFRNVTYVELACLVAPFVVDKDREIHMSKELWARTRNLWRLFKKMVNSLKPVVRMMSLRGFEAPTVMFWPAATVFLWSQEVDWEEINAHVSADEGDISMMLLRTADHLRQLLDLEKEEPIIASKALEAITQIMRPPLI